MLKTRVITALVLLFILLAVLFLNSFLLFSAVVTLFLGAAAWECSRLFKSRYPLMGGIVAAVLFALILLGTGQSGFSTTWLLGLCVLIWLIRLVPSLGLGLPPLEGAGNALLNVTYGIAILGCFVAIIDLYQRSAVYLLSVMAIVWTADIGAYFAGKAFGKHKLAPSISPGKSWEGAVGGWAAVLVLGALCTWHPSTADSFAARLLVAWGWLGFASVMSVLVAASIVGDLFESQLKRRAGMKDSSNLLPGHGGVLDRIDALIPTLPLAVLLGSWL